VSVLMWLVDTAEIVVAAVAVALVVAPIDCAGASSIAALQTHRRYYVRRHRPETNNDCAQLLALTLQLPSLILYHLVLYVRYQLSFGSR